MSLSTNEYHLAHLQFHDTAITKIKVGNYHAIMQLTLMECICLLKPTMSAESATPFLIFRMILVQVCPAHFHAHYLDLQHQGEVR